MATQDSDLCGHGDALRTYAVTANQAKQLLLEASIRQRGERPIPFRLVVPYESDSRIDGDALEAAVGSAIQQHALLGSAFIPAHGVSPTAISSAAGELVSSGVAAEGLFRMTTADVMPFRLSRTGVQTRAQSDVAIVEVIEALAAEPVNSDRGPLVSGHLISSPDRNVFVLSAAHIAADRASLQIVRRTIQTAYDGLTDQASARKPEPGSDGRHLGEIESTKLATGYFNDALEYWDATWKRFHTMVPELSELSFALPYPRVPRYSVETVGLALDPMESKLVIEACRRLGATPYMLGMSALAVVLGNLLGRSGVAIWGNFANRSAEDANTVGWLANSHLVGIDLTCAINGRQVVETVREAVLLAITHESLPLALLWRHRGEAPQGGFRVLFDYVDESQHDRNQAPECRGLRLRRIRVQTSRRRYLGLNILMRRHGDSLVLSANYWSEVFVQTAMTQLLEMVRNGLVALSTKPSAVPVMR